MLELNGLAFSCLTTKRLDKIAPRNISPQVCQDSDNRCDDRGCILISQIFSIRRTFLDEKNTNDPTCLYAKRRNITIAYIPSTTKSLYLCFKLNSQQRKRAP